MSEAVTVSVSVDRFLKVVLKEQTLCFSLRLLTKRRGRA